MREATNKENIKLVLLGNTGSGKSLIGRALGGDFESRRSTDGQSVTRKNETTTVTLNDVQYTLIDTPGLVELSKERMQENADEIAAALNTGGQFKILLVVRDSAGRDDPGIAYLAYKLFVALSGRVKFALVVNRIPVNEMGTVTDETLRQTCDRYNKHADVLDKEHVLRISEGNIVTEGGYEFPQMESMFLTIRRDVSALLESMGTMELEKGVVRTFRANETEYGWWQTVWEIFMIASTTLFWNLMSVYINGTPEMIEEAKNKIRDLRKRMREKDRALSLSLPWLGVDG